MAYINLNGVALATESSGTITMPTTVKGTGGLRSQQVFTTVGAVTWTRPSGITTIEIYCTGGGAGGGGGNPNWNNGGGGGAGATAIGIVDVTSIPTLALVSTTSSPKEPEYVPLVTVPSLVILSCTALTRVPVHLPLEYQ